MRLYRYVAACKLFVSLYLESAVCAPTSSAFPILSDAGNDLALALSKPFNGSNLGAFRLSSNYSAELGWEKTTWKISDTMSLDIVVCNWEPDPDTILVVLAAAETTVGKKPGATRLDKKFTQRSNNKYNTLYFEIRPDYGVPRLTWGDVAEVLGEDGLVKFYTTTNYWHTIYFNVKHTTRGELGSGAVRRWWQLTPPNNANSTAVS